MNIINTAFPDFAPVTPSSTAPAMSKMLAELERIAPWRCPLFPTAEDAEAGRDHMMAVAAVMDQYFSAVGRVLEENFTTRTDGLFETPVVTTLGDNEWLAFGEAIDRASEPDDGSDAAHDARQAVL